MEIAVNKLMLDLETLCVDSFQTARETPARGTVLGRDSTVTQPAPSGQSDYEVCTYDASCQGGGTGRPRTCW